MKFINLSGNSLEEIVIDQLHYLRYLDLSKNRLIELDASISELADLSVGENRLKEVRFGYYSNLSKLDLNGNQLTSIELSHLSKLTQLKVNRNKLVALDVSYQANLVFLDMSHNLIQEVQDLPVSLQELRVDLKAVGGYNFEGMVNLNQLSLCNGKISREDVTGLRRETVFKI